MDMTQKYELIVGHGTTIIDPQGGSVQVIGGSSELPVHVTMLRNPGTPYHGELQYLSLLAELIAKHENDPMPREDRTGTGTFSVFGRQIRFDLGKGFPLLTTKKIHTKSMVAELLWMLAGDTNVETLRAQGVRIWDEWAGPDGALGPVYGAQWRRHLSKDPSTIAQIDQISEVIATLREKPNDRGHIVTAWNPAEIHDMALRPCHCLFQFYVEDGLLSCQLYQRSADIFLGVPFNIASYALLTHLIAREVGLGVGEFVHTFGDLHLYANHVEQAKTQLSRTPTPFPTVQIADKGIFDLRTEDVSFLGYVPHDTIKAEVSV